MMCAALLTTDWGRGKQSQCIRERWHDGSHLFVRKPRDRFWWWPRLLYRLRVHRLVPE